MYILFVLGLPWQQRVSQVRKKNYMLSHMCLSEKRKQTNKIIYYAQISMYDLTKFRGTEGIVQGQTLTKKDCKGRQTNMPKDVAAIKT